MKQALFYTFKFWAVTIIWVLMAGRQLLVIKAHSGAMSYAQSYQSAKDSLLFALPFYIVFLIAVLLIKRLNASTSTNRILRATVALMVYVIALWLATIKIGVDPHLGEYWLLSPLFGLSILINAWRLKLEPPIENTLASA
jgi:hypothetical protein